MEQIFFYYETLGPMISHVSIIVNVNLPSSPVERYNVMSVGNNQAKSLVHHVACIHLQALIKAFMKALSIHDGRKVNVVDDDLLYKSPQLDHLHKSIQLF